MRKGGAEGTAHFRFIRENILSQIGNEMSVKTMKRSILTQPMGDNTLKKQHRKVFLHEASERLPATSYAF